MERGKGAIERGRDNSRWGQMVGRPMKGIGMQG